MYIFNWSDTTNQTAQEYSSIFKNRGSSITIGGFDGPHVGHRTLFDSVLEHSKKNSLVPGIVTFIRSPSAFKKPTEFLGDVSSTRIRLDWFKTYGFEFVLLIDFSSKFGKMSGGVFFNFLVETVHMHYLAVGQDFRCGHRLDTGVMEIASIAQQKGFRFDSIQHVESKGIRISSSAIRNAIKQADFSLAEKLLGHPFLLDLDIPHWIKRDANFVAPIKAFSQILPRWGLYQVLLYRNSDTIGNANIVISEEEVILSLVQNSFLLDSMVGIVAQFRLS